MQSIIKVAELLKRKILVTRESAAILRQQIESAIRTESEVILDFEGIEAVTPSFVDEIMGMIDDARAAAVQSIARATFRHTPTALSEKFVAIGRRHGAEISQSKGNTWEIINCGSGANLDRF